MDDLAKFLKNLKAWRREDRGHICPPQATLSGPGPVSAHDRHSTNISRKKINIHILAMKTFYLLSLNDSPKVTEQIRKLEF